MGHSRGWGLIDVSQPVSGWPCAAFGSLTSVTRILVVLNQNPESDIGVKAED